MRELIAADFAPAALPQPLRDDEIHLWFFPQWSGAVRAAAESNEVRAMLAAYLQRSTDELTIVRDAHGKPRLSDDALQFNLSHSGNALLLALARAAAVGVDLEASRSDRPRRERPVNELAQRYFDPNEADALARLPEAERQRAFLCLWTCKEAVLKAHGGGIAFGLDRVVFALDDNGAARHLRRFDNDANTASWHVIRLLPAPDTCGALAWSGPERHVRAFKLSSSQA